MKAEEVKQREKLRIQGKPTFLFFKVRAKVEPVRAKLVKYSVQSFLPWIPSIFSIHRPTPRGLEDMCNKHRVRDGVSEREKRRNCVLNFCFWFRALFLHTQEDICWLLSLNAFNSGRVRKGSMVWKKMYVNYVTPPEDSSWSFPTHLSNLNTNFLLCTSAGRSVCL